MKKSILLIILLISLFSFITCDITNNSEIEETFNVENPNNLNLMYNLDYTNSQDIQCNTNFCIWMLKENKIANWMGKAYERELTVFEPINIIWVDYRAKNEEEAANNVSTFLTNNNFFQEAAPFHTDGYYALYDRNTIINQHPINAAWVDAQHPSENNHGRIFPTYRVNSNKISPVFITLGAFSREGEWYGLTGHDLISFNQARDALSANGDWEAEALKLNIGNQYKAELEKDYCTLDHNGTQIFTLPDIECEEVWIVEGEGFLEDGSGTLTLTKEPGEDVTITDLAIYNNPYTFTYSSKSITINGENIELKLNGTIAVQSNTSLFDLKMIGTLKDGVGAGTFILNFNNPNWNDDTGIWNATLQSGSGITMTTSN